MANANRPSGFTPVRNINGSTWNGQGNIYSIAASYGTALYIGDPVISSGTSDAFAIGDILMVDDSTGKLVATTGSPESEPFVVMETVAALTADALVHVMFTGY